MLYIDKRQFTSNITNNRTASSTLYRMSQELMLIFRILIPDVMKYQKEVREV
jgi:hypothetical protein